MRTSLLSEIKPWELVGTMGARYVFIIVLPFGLSEKSIIPVDKFSLVTVLLSFNKCIPTRDLQLNANLLYLVFIFPLFSSAFMENVLNVCCTDSLGPLCFLQCSSVD